MQYNLGINNKYLRIRLVDRDLGTTNPIGFGYGTSIAYTKIILTVSRPVVTERARCTTGVCF